MRVVLLLQHDANECTTITNTGKLVIFNLSIEFFDDAMIDTFSKVRIGNLLFDICHPAVGLIFAKALREKN